MLLSVVNMDFLAKPCESGKLINVVQVDHENYGCVSCGRRRNRLRVALFIVCVMTHKVRSST
jgi:hypothetical protein